MPVWISTGNSRDRSGLQSPDDSRRVGPACVSPWWAGGNGDLTQDNIQSKWNVSSRAGPPDSRFLVPPYEPMNNPESWRSSYR